MRANPTPRPHACSACGETHDMCLAHRKSDGKPCGGQPRNGSDVCRMHGGGAPRGKTAAAERVRRHDWVLLYLFGASPALGSTFVHGREHERERLSGDTLYLTYATSLRI